MIIDGLDSCEQDKILLILDTVNVLFSETDTPFITFLCIDPFIISKVNCKIYVHNLNEIRGENPEKFLQNFCEIISRFYNEKPPEVMTPIVFSHFGNTDANKSCSFWSAPRTISLVTLRFPRSFCILLQNYSIFSKIIRGSFKNFFQISVKFTQKSLKFLWKLLKKFFNLRT